MRRREVWIGLVSVVPREGVHLLGNAEGAYVNVLAFASSRFDFHRQVTKGANQHGLDVEEIENAEPLSNRDNVENDLLGLASEVAETGCLKFGAFHTFDEG